MAITVRQARRKLGSRTTRRRGTNGKVISGRNHRRYPHPVKRICVKVREHVRSAAS